MKKIKTALLCMIATLAVACLSACSNITTARAADSNPQTAATGVTLKVGYVETPGLSYINEYGNLVGCNIDYLDEIARYTNWQYDYIDAGTAEALTDNFMKGDYDLMGSTFYFQNADDYFGYPDYSCGNTVSALVARKSDTSIVANNLESLKNKTIGVYKNATENIRRLKTFLDINGITCAIKEFSSADMDENGKLYHKLYSNEVDLLLANNVDQDSGFRRVATFQAQPHYIVCQKEATAVLAQLNQALKTIYDCNPYYATDCYNKFFPDTLLHPELTKDERAYVAKKQTVKVAVANDFYPLIFTDDTGNTNGILPDILQLMHEYSGLNFDYYFCPTYNEMLGAIQDGKADMLGFYLDGRKSDSNYNLIATADFLSLGQILLVNKTVVYPSNNLTAAVLKGRSLPDELTAAKVIEYDTFEKMVQAVNNGAADFTFGNAANLQRVTAKLQLHNLTTLALSNSKSPLHFATAMPADTLYTILNKSISNLPGNKLTSILDKHNNNLSPYGYTLRDFISNNPLLFTFIIVFICALIFALIAIILYSKAHANTAKLKLERANAESVAKTNFLSRMSHEIRTPMNAIVGLSDLSLMKNDVPPNIKRNLTNIRSSAYYLRDLISDILCMSQIDNDKLTLSAEPFSLGKLLSELESMMENEATRRDLTFCLESNVPHDGLTGDAIRLRQVLSNLLSNAFKFSGGGSKIILSVNETACDDKSATIKFCVSDFGIGIKEEDLTRIFNSFEQAGNSVSKSQGTGLGLPISQNIVNLMGGKLEVDSAVGKGSSFFFTVTIPYGVPPVDSEHHYNHNGELLNHLAILLVEDNDLNAEIAAELLVIQGATVTRAVNGQEALSLFQDSSPKTYQAILMDIQMPVMDGLSATREIRSLARDDAKKIPIIAMTANAFREDEEAAMKAGMNGVVFKPIVVEKLYDTLAELLNDANKK